MRRVRAVAVAAVLASSLAGSATAGAAEPRYSGPAVGSAAEAPYTVLLLALSESDGMSSCTGTILDERRVLTAAHCTLTADGQPIAPEGVLVLAGTAQVVSDEPPADAQINVVSGIRRHPAYLPELAPYADVAVLELADPWAFTPAVAPVALPPVGGPPQAGSPVRGYGWGLSGPGTDDGLLHLLDMIVAPTDACGAGLAGVGCASSSAGGICFGDSGGPILAGDGGQLVGVASTGTGAADCTPNLMAGFVDLSAPGIGLWVRGDDAAPSLPRTTDPPTLAAPPLTGGAATCSAPAWTGAERTAVAFVHQDTGEVVQEGSSTEYVPQPSDVGHPLTCRSVAESAGGTGSIAAAGAVSVVAAELSLAIGRRRAVMSYAGAPRVGLRLSATRPNGRRAWSRDVGGARRVRLPRVRPGRYRVCVDAPAAGQFASATACQRWRVRRR